MSKSILKSTLVAAAISLSLMAPASQAQAVRPASTAAAVKQIIADQGNAALVAIRADLKAALKVIKPAQPPARPSRVSVPAATGSLPAMAAAAE